MSHVPGFTGSPIDRCDYIRADASALAAAVADPRSWLLGLSGLDLELDERGGLTWRSLAAAAEGSELIFLGRLGDRHCFAELPAEPPEGVAFLPSIWRALDMLTPADAGTYAAARSLIDWHARHRFCARCGAPTGLFRAGWGRSCPSCSAEHFPRVDPVVIMLAVHEDQVLVGRSPRLPPRRYSALAGFVEPGESLEEAVARELYEEAGIRARNVRYVASQPWPFPSSLMIACMAETDDPVLAIDATELDDAMWVSREDVAEALEGAPTARFLAPPPYAIAHTLFKRWLEQPLSNPD